MPTYPMPYPHQSGEYDNSGMYRNPAGTQPFPSPADMPIGFWSGSQQAVEFLDYSDFRIAAGADRGFPYPYGPPIANLAARVFAAATWSSPVFDLQPELRGMSNNQSNRSTLSTPAGQFERTPFTAVPIWGSPGKLLRVQIDSLVFPQRPESHVMLLAWEEGHVLDPNLVVPITATPGQDITAVLTSGASTYAQSTTVNTLARSILNFAPCGGPSACRYWRQNLLFLYVTDGVLPPLPVTTPPFTIQASYY